MLPGPWVPLFPLGVWQRACPRGEGVVRIMDRGIMTHRGALQCVGDGWQLSTSFYGQRCQVHLTGGSSICWCANISTGPWQRRCIRLVLRHDTGTAASRQSCRSPPCPQMMLQRARWTYHLGAGSLNFQHFRLPQHDSAFCPLHTRFHSQPVHLQPADNRLPLFLSSTSFHLSKRLLVQMAGMATMATLQAGMAVEAPAPGTSLSQTPPPPLLQQCCQSNHVRSMHKHARAGPGIRGCALFAMLRTQPQGIRTSAPALES